MNANEIKKITNSAKNNAERAEIKKKIAEQKKRDLEFDKGVAFFKEKLNKELEKKILKAAKNKETSTYIVYGKDEYWSGILSTAREYFEKENFKTYCETVCTWDDPDDGKTYEDRFYISWDDKK